MSLVFIGRSKIVIGMPIFIANVSLLLCQSQQLFMDSYSDDFKAIQTNHYRENSTDMGSQVPSSSDTQGSHNPSLANSPLLFVTNLIHLY